MHYKASLENIRRAPFQALAAISVLTLTFFVTTFILLLAYGSNQVVRYFESRPQIIAFLGEEATDEQIGILQAKLKNDERIESIKFVSKEEALEIYRDATSENPLLGELVSPSIFPASIEFSVTNLTHTQDLISEVRDEDIVESVGFTATVGDQSSLGEVITKLREIATYVRVGGAISISVLILTSFLVLTVVIGLRITIQRKEIDNLNLIGARPSFIRAPITFEAINYAVIGTFLGWLLATVIVLYSTPTLLAYFHPIEVLPRSSQSFFLLLGALLAIELVVAIIIAVFGSFISVSRSLKITKK